ncbi:HlyD family efflux transporter periplasmic adaptor subunit [Vogesella indigofera]|uniref:HlyD family efflux transporter periplasmic adaptor subunit n=1 Tax=Vogesella indigofera TaxID=45465 RepID=UPI003F4368F9
MELKLDPLREDLELLDDGRLAGGQPGWKLFDPLKNRFYQLDWLSFEILSRWHLGQPEPVLEAIRQQTTLQVAEEDIAALHQFLQLHELLQLPPGQHADSLARYQRLQGSIGSWLIHNYLFFRLPLLRPDAVVSRLSGYCQLFFSPHFYWLTLLVAVFSLWQVGQQWDAYSSTLVDMFSLQGVLYYGVAIMFVKIAHEFGHALCAKRFGCHIPTMGLAFLVLWPVAYTDTNDVWRLPDKRQRLMVSSAGIVTELSIAVWATLCWLWLPDGGLRTVAFLLSSTTWISTLLINASPFMRFDGYFILSDALGVVNLHQRCFDYARWHLRRVLFALPDAPPEYLDPRHHWLAIVFAWVTWLYRLVVFLGIAALVYHFFIKLVGIVLFLIEIVWFVAGPVWKEIQVWMTMKSQIVEAGRYRLLLLLLAVTALFCLLPLPGHTRLAAMIYPAQLQTVYAPSDAYLLQSHIRQGQAVSAGQPLFTMTSPQLRQNFLLSEQRSRQLAAQENGASFDDASRKDWGVFNSKWQHSRSEGGYLQKEMVKYFPVAAFAGRVVDVNPDVQQAGWLSAREPMAVIAGNGPYEVVAYLPESQLVLLDRDAGAVFIRGGVWPQKLALQVVSVSADAESELSVPELALDVGGDVAVRSRNGRFYPEKTVYKVVFRSLQRVDFSKPLSRERGIVVVSLLSSSSMLAWLREVAAVFYREFGF